MKRLSLVVINMPARVLFGLLLSVLTLVTVAHAGEVLSPIVPSVRDGGPMGLSFYKSQDGNLKLAYQQKYPDRPSELFYLIKNAERWSTPILIPGLDQNERVLHGVVSLANGLPLLLMSGDNTDYARVFNLKTPPAKPSKPDDPIMPGISDDQLQQLLGDNQRLFYRMEINGVWTQPVPLPDSFRASKPVLTAGEDGSALVVYGRDTDKNPATPGDSQLFATVYKNSVWTKPVQLTANSKAKYGVQVQYVKGRYLIAWVEDQDAVLTNRADSKLLYAAVSSTGSILSSPATIVSADQNSPLPVLGRIGNDASLLWMSQTNSAEDARRGIWESRYDGSWSAAKQTGLQGLQMGNGRIYPVAGGTLFVYQDGGILQSASLTNNTWSSSSMLAQVLSNGVLISQLEHVIDPQGHIHFAASGHVRAAGETAQSAEAGDGLFYSSLPLSYDLQAKVLDVKPYAKYPGKPVAIEFIVENIGALPSAAFTVEIKAGAEVLKTLSGEALAPGKSRRFQFSHTIDKIETPLEISVIAEGDINQENNVIQYAVKVLPDYAVHSVIRKDATHFEADIVDLKGIAAPPVKVEVFLNDGGQQNLVASGMFDPNDGLPMTITTEATVDKITPYQLLVKVNSDRKIEEDKFNNNQGAYNNNILPDFTISQFYLTAEQVHVTVSNRGSLPVGGVDVLLTDDPLLAGKGQPGGTPWLYKNVSLNSSGEATLVLNRSDYPALTGDNLYAVANPYGTTREIDRNNNLHRTLIRSALAMGETGGGSGGGSGGGGGPGGGGGGTTQSAQLVFENIHSWCDNVQVTVANTGGAYAIAPMARVVDANGFTVSSRSLATILAGETEVVTFHDLAAGDYSIYLSHTTLQGNQTTTGSATVELGPGCQGIAQNDVELNEVIAQTANDNSDEVNVQLSFSSRGRLANYRKPLIRVTLLFEVKQGVQVHYTQAYPVYLPGNTANGIHKVNLRMPRSAFPAGTSKLNVRIADRDDEATAANNIYTLVVNGGGL